MKVVMVGSMPPLRGISSYCASLAQALSKRAPVEFISFKHMYPRGLYPGGSQVDETFPAMDSSNLNIRRSLSWYNPVGWLSEGARVQADVLHVQHWTMPLSPVMATILWSAHRRGIPTVLTLHNVKPHEPSPMFDATTRTLCRLADCCIVHSLRNKQEAIDHLKLEPARVRVVRHGVLDLFAEGSEDAAGARRALCLPLDAPVILFFGAIRPYKGLDTLLRAFRRVRKLMPNARLIIAGRCWGDWPRYAKIINQLGLGTSVHLAIDYIPASQVRKYFDAADIVALPYRHFDAQSGAGLVGVGFGKPIVVTDVGGLPELVLDKRFVVPPDDHRALADRLVLSLSNPLLLEQMRVQTREVARACSWDAIAESTLSLYRSMLHPNTVPLETA